MSANARALAFDENRITVENIEWQAPARVLDARWVDGLVVVVLDWTSLRQKERRSGQIHNLRAYSASGEHEWTAEHPTSSTAHCYTTIVSVAPQVVASFAGFDCWIDPADGKLAKSVFTK